MLRRVETFDRVINAALFDGSVRPVSQSVDVAVWQAAATIASGDLPGTF